MSPSPTSLRITLLGYGSQGRAHALNLRDSGFDVTVGLRPGGPTELKARADGFDVKAPAEAVKGADLVALILWLLDGPSRSGAWNATAPQPVTNREFARALAASLNRPAFLPMPAPVVRLSIVISSAMRPPSRIAMRSFR